MGIYQIFPEVKQNCDSSHLVGDGGDKYQPVQKLLKGIRVCTMFTAVFIFVLLRGQHEDKLRCHTV